MLLNEYLQLLANREGKVVLGKKWFNLWLLTIVLTATFISIAFSNGSLKYLSDKMNDPFTNWVNISNDYGQGRFDEMREALTDSAVQHHYGFKDVQSDNNFALNLFDKTGNSTHYFQCRFFEYLNSDLVRAILTPENLIGGYHINPDELSDQTFGYIITFDAIKKLGYSDDDIPAYVEYLSVSEWADTLGVKLFQDKYAAAPMPVLAVVKKLPMNMDIIGSRYWFEQYSNDETHPYNMNNVDYQRQLLYFVESNVDGFEQSAKSVVPDSLVNNFSALELDEDYLEMRPCKPGKFFSVYVGDNLPLKVYQDYNRKLLAKLKSDHVHRVYRYSVSDYHLSVCEFLSVNFETLDSIRSFEAYVKDNYKIQIEMSQVNAKENFNAVSVMANILSWAMIVFSIICIILFMVNMLQSYFQKVKRNLGTFKAFGINSKELIRVYVIILFAIIIVAILMALIIAWVAELLLPLFGIMKDGEYNYLSLWSFKTIWSIIIVMAATIITVNIVMSKMLKKTPGDLIYDRD